MLAFLIATSLLVPTTSPTPLVRKGSPLPLETAVESSTFICIGTVDRVERVPCPSEWALGPMGYSPPRELPFARIRVERVLKGDSCTEFVWHETWTTWPCDTTQSLVGERALFLLGAAQTDRQSDAARAAVAQSLGPGLVVRNIGSGDGLEPIRLVDDGVECVHYGGAPYALDLPGPAAFPNRPNARRRGTQSLAAIAAWIEDLARFPRARCAIRMRSDALDEPRGQAFEVRFLADGSFRLAIGVDRYQVVRSGRIEAAVWEPLRAAIERASAEAAPLASASAALDRRDLTVRLDGADRRWSLPASVPDASTLPSDTRAAQNALLTTWELAHGALECLECADHGTADRRARAR